MDSSLALVEDGTSGLSTEFTFLPCLSCKMIPVASDIKRIKKIESVKASGQGWPRSHTLQSFLWAAQNNMRKNA